MMSLQKVSIRAAVGLSLCLGAFETVHAQSAKPGSFQLPPFESPYLGEDGAIQCDQIPPKDAEKVDCPVQPVHPQTDPRSGGDWSIVLPPLKDPFEDVAALDCKDVAQKDREKAGFPQDCPVADTPVKPIDPVIPDGPRPLKRDDFPELARRVLSLPGASLSSSPGQDGAEALPSFSIFYVYEEQKIGSDLWYKIGKNAFGETDGWIRADQAEDWRTMLVMQYAPKGARGRVLFFKRKSDLQDFVKDRYVSEEVQFAYEKIDDGSYDADYFIAIEPSLSVAKDSTYLMPVLDHRPEFTRLSEPLQLLEVAGLNLNAEAIVQTDVRDVENRPAPRRAGDLRRASIGVVFVIDTTFSMAPYIETTRQIVRTLVATFEGAQRSIDVSYGLVGYRDNVDVDDRIGYVTKIFQPLDLEITGQETLKNFELMDQASVPTSGFSEDTYAGLDVALNQMEWEPFAGKVVILITDAAPRGEFDPLVARPGYGALNIIADTERLGVGVIPLHLKTPPGVRTGNFDEAGSIYKQLGRTGSSLQKYRPIDTDDLASFQREMSEIADALVSVNLERWGQGKLIEQPDVKPDGLAETASQALESELFRGQMEYLGSKRGQAAPRFYRAWAADKDLANPVDRSLEVKVFLTRTQLSALSTGVQRILNAYLMKESTGSDFFDAMQAIAAETSVEGARTGDLERAGQLLPSFLEALPYKSDFLELDRDIWRDKGASGQREIKNALENKLLAYQSLAQDRRAWIDLSAGDKGLEASPISLDLLP